MLKEKKKKRTPLLNKGIRTGDTVNVIAGNDRGKTGKVLSRTKERITIEGVNIRKKHTKATQEGQTGQILEIERAIHASNVRKDADNGKKGK